jgi:mannose-6-phosphate isomerase-like protein (cupin superfamily)
MLIVDMNECPQFVAGDETLLREVLHPHRDQVALPYSLAHAILSPGSRSLSHRLRGSEVYYVLRGRARIHIDGEIDEIRAGQVVYVPPGAAQFVENMGDEELSFLCIVAPAWRAADEEVGDGPQHQEAHSERG